MQFFHPIAQDDAALVGFGLAVMLVAPNGAPTTEQKAGRLAGLGCTITVEPNVRRAQAAMASGQHDLLVIDAEATGGLTAALSVLSSMRRSGIETRAIIVSHGVKEQTFPVDPMEPILLRAPMSAVGVRVAVEYALRDREQAQIAA
jgi:hypothetical protein